ncbi:hypothetical protein [Streptomyces sp. NPDC088261]|uniref:hypothetical protein n=1 Tax=Streptomyces sp. NPDC088261 TaxID=3365851 RepID=UPI0038077AD7
MAIAHEWNTQPHLQEYEGDPEARPFSREELQRFLDYADDQVVRAVKPKRKGALAAYRDATLFKVIYGWGLRRTETSKLDVVDFGGTRRLASSAGTAHSTSATANELGTEGLTLRTCTQPDLERWMAALTVSYRDETGHSIRWSVQHRHARDLTYGTVRWKGPLSAIDSEKRRADARRLLNDDTLPTPDRVAGLLLILYAQKISTISQLTVDDVNIGGDTVAIKFGTSPVVLPAPLANLIREHVATRRGEAKIGTPDDVPSLFPGGHPGLPLTDSQIGKRLHRIAIWHKRDRSTALCTLATEVPAAILARMLGIHIKVAVQWQQASAGDWAAYSADVNLRSSTAPAPSAPTTPR